jgi:hypothetical protein
MLDSLGIHNWKILESSDRLGGRMMTAYLNGSSPEDGQYHEMGPMRFPYEITDPDTNETYPIQDMKMVFQLAEVLNEMNAGKDKKLQIEFIPWIQKANNTPITTTARRPDGTFPGQTEIAENPDYAAVVGYSNETAAEEAIQALEDVKGLTPERIKFYALNVFRAHKEAVEEGLFDFSEVEYLRKVIGTDLNTTDEVTPSSVVWPMWEYETGGFLRCPKLEAVFSLTLNISILPCQQVEYNQRRAKSYARSFCTHVGGPHRVQRKSACRQIQRNQQNAGCLSPKVWRQSTHHQFDDRDV